ncbi:MAG: protein kinase [Acidobacteria bacterium]|nr:protein kinase [Acidobacteriota bacterium]
MTLSTGTRLSHYEITSQIGKGGMGEVYQAKDQKLGRDVAIKVLPEEFARDTDRVARFQREAKLLASLNHPNIAAIYGLEEFDGTHFLVMELIEGQTLDERIKSGPIPVEEALKLGLQIVEALEAAHEKGVIHRDLKPANIKVTPDGKVKVLDFGLAKAFAGEQGDLNLSNSPTLSVAATRQGVILGTAAYMSPEQARGKEVDKRADIWAFGVVLFEMLAGRQVFTGDTVSDTLASVLAREPEWQSLPQNLHPRIRLLLERCLKKESRDRYSGINDARVDIQEAWADPSGVFVQSVVTEKPAMGIRKIFPRLAAALIIGAILAGAAVWRLMPTEPGKVIRFDYEIPDGQQFSDLDEFVFAVSPDGDSFVYSASGGLYLRTMSELEVSLIDGTEGAQNPFFSPDGRWIGFWSTANNIMQKIPVSGGAPVPLTDITPTGFIHWFTDDMIVFGQAAEGIRRISTDGGPPELLIQSEGREIFSPQILPDGKSVLFMELVGSMQGQIIVHSLKTGESKELFLGDSARYLPTGHIVYALLDNNLYAIPFNADKLETNGIPIPVVKGIFRAEGAPQYTISDSGTLIYIPETGTDIQYTPVWVDRNGNEESLGVEPNHYFYSSISPDGTRVALCTQGSTASTEVIWIWDTIRKNLVQLTFDDADNYYPLWTPDGEKIAYYSHGGTENGIYWKAADGTGIRELLCSAPGSRLDPHSWSDDGKTLILEKRVPPGTTSDIAVLPMEGDRKLKLLLDDRYTERQPKVSPDGRCLAYTSNESGREEVYVRPFPDVDSGGKQKVSTDGGSDPLWSPDGRELFYRVGQSVMAVSVKTGPIISLETPKTLFNGAYSSEFRYNWDIHPAGNRFLMMKPTPGIDNNSSAETPRKIIIITNWFEELKELVPVD